MAPFAVFVYIHESTGWVMFFRLKSRAVDAGILIAFFFIFLALSVARNQPDIKNAIYSDVEGYYMYLPAVFIQKSVHNIPHRSVGWWQNDKGENVIKYTCGTAYFYTPFFLAAHVYAKHFKYEADGFSEPYLYAMLLCGVFWGIIGLYLLKNLLLHYFSRGVTWFTLFNITLGTNYLFYLTREPGMSHVYSFTLVVAIVHLVRKYYLEPSRGKAMLLGFLIGWLVLIRPTNIVFLVFILLFGVASKAAFTERLRFLYLRRADIFYFTPLLLLPAIPQFIYWHEILGKWVSYSYANEHFIYWNRPKILAVLFDTQNGLFVYAPVLFFIFPALLLYRKDVRLHFAGFTVVFGIITYIFASWWAWWFGGAYGHRC